jgi:hypothetical protein
MAVWVVSASDIWPSHPPAMGADWRVLAPAFSPVVHPKRPDFFSFFFFRASPTDETPAISVFYAPRLVNGFQARVHTG